MVQKAFFDNETANSIADPETYNRSNNEKGDVHVDHTSLPEEPTSGFADVCPIGVVAVSLLASLTERLMVNI